ncbi:hypothetical protein Agub_g9482 [Astrephomene gubernaculifera]|uniref:Uncharacterized protein n=1 Tax=Astrephomene gubernaculifera TaxID=47775 RepID=A0AAD3DV87_9CHLO|nr:hypothetical protein Agub_g9482 [Astrephomene gubernaculifera]
MRGTGPSPPHLQAGKLLSCNCCGACHHPSCAQLFSPEARPTDNIHLGLPRLPASPRSNGEPTGASMSDPCPPTPQLPPSLAIQATSRMQTLPNPSLSTRSDACECYNTGARLGISTSTGDGSGWFCPACRCIRCAKPCNRTILNPGTLLPLQPPLPPEAVLVSELDALPAPGTGQRRSHAAQLALWRLMTAAGQQARPQQGCRTALRLASIQLYGKEAMPPPPLPPPPPTLAPEATSELQQSAAGTPACKRRRLTEYCCEERSCAPTGSSALGQLTPPPLLPLLPGSLPPPPPPPPATPSPAAYSTIDIAGIACASVQGAGSARHPASRRTAQRPQTDGPGRHGSPSRTTREALTCPIAPRASGAISSSGAAAAAGGRCRPG